MSYEQELIESGQCAEIVMVNTEDGPVDGRCLKAIEPGDYACPSHMAEIEEWSAKSEMEKLEWERQHEMDDNGPW